MLKVEINGRGAKRDELAKLAFASYGHFTFMQVRDGRVRGLDLHLDRLCQSTVELFGQPLEREPVRDRLRHALGDGPNTASVQIIVFSFAQDAIRLGKPVKADLLIRVSAPISADPNPVRVQSIAFERFLPHIKNVATMGLAYYPRAVRVAGFDDALFVDRDGFVSEGSIWNIAFLDGNEVVWPTAQALPGIGMLVALQELQRLGVSVRRKPIHISEVGSFQAAALMNSITAGQPIAGIDGVHYGQQASDALIQALHRAHDAVPLERI